MSEYDQLLSKKRENRKTANTLEGIVNELRRKQEAVVLVGNDNPFNININSEIRELEILIDKLRI